MSLKPRRTFEFDTFLLDARERILSRDGTPVPIAPKAFDALLLLVENAGNLVSRGTLREQIWPGQIVEESTIGRLIADLRKVLADTGEERRYIETVPKHGYRFIAVAKPEIVEAEVVDIPEIAAAAPAGSQKRFGDWKLAVAGAGVLAAAIAGIAALMERTARIESVVITPFEVLGHSPSVDIFELGLQDSLVMEMSSFSRFAVIKAGAVGDNPVELGRRHHAGFVLTGTIQPLNPRVHVNARLLRTSTGEAVWTHGFDESVDDMYKVQSRIAALSVAELLPVVPSGERKLFERRHPANGTAYRDYLLGRVYWYRRDAASYPLAIEMFKKAIAAEPNYALAWVGLADCYLLSESPGGRPFERSLPLAQAAVEKAVAIDPALGEAHASLAMIAGNYNFDWDRAESELKTAIRLSPAYVTAHHWYAEFLTMMGKFEQSEAEFEVTRNLDPASPIILVDIAQLRLFENKPEDSLRVLDEALRLDPNFILAHERKGISLMVMRRVRDARAEFALADRMANREMAPCMKAWTAAVAGQRTDALRFLAQAEETADNPMMLAAVWAELGDTDRGMTWLELACEHRSSGMISVRVNPLFNRLRKSPRFEALLDRMNLTQSR